MQPFRAISLVLALSACTQARAADPVDPSTLYTLSTAGTSSRLKAGEKGVFVLSIQSKPGAHVSDEAPLKLELAGKNVTPAKVQLSRGDSVAKKSAGQSFTDPRFEVPLTATGTGSLDAKLTFFICTETLCARQQKTVSVPIEVL